MTKDWEGHHVLIFPSIQQSDALTIQWSVAHLSEQLIFQNIKKRKKMLGIQETEYKQTSLPDLTKYGDSLQSGMSIKINRL